VLIVLDQNIKPGGARSRRGTGKRPGNRKFIGEKAKNRGLDIARGEFISFVEGDDCVDLKMYQALYERAIERGAGVIACSTRYIDSQTEEVLLFKQVLPPCNVAEADKKREAVSRSYRIAIWHKLFHKELCHGLRYPKGIFYEDYPVIRLLALTTERVEHIDKYYYFYCRKERTIADSPYSLQKSINYIASIKLLLSKLNDRDLIDYGYPIDVNTILLELFVALLRILDRSMRTQSMLYNIRHMGVIHHLIKEMLSLLHSRQIKLKHYPKIKRKIKKMGGGYKKLVVCGMHYGALSLLLYFAFSRLILHPAYRVLKRFVKLEFNR